jgi:hypothetical protein
MVIMTTIAIDQLVLVTGGQQATAPQAPDTRQIVRDEIAEEERFQDKERFRAWEKSHPFSALMCQGDRSCM